MRMRAGYNYLYLKYVLPADRVDKISMQIFILPRLVQTVTGRPQIGIRTLFPDTILFFFLFCVCALHCDEKVDLHCTI